MFHKPKLILIYVKKAMVYPIKLIFVGLAFFFLLDLYEIFTTGVAHGRYGKVYTTDSSMFGYLSIVFLKISFSAFFLAIAYGIREKVNLESITQKDQ
jgi:hypothetical protein